MFLRLGDGQRPEKVDIKKKKKMEQISNLKSLSEKDLTLTNGGGWIADFVEKLLCGCYEGPKYPTEAYHNANMMKGSF
ncbi:MAG: hypothetical protein ACQESQ_09400 [Bacteroidota bacterium]